MNSSPHTETGHQPGDWWARRPRRSVRDRKIAGVAGGLGRAFGVDPVLIRVAFVVMTIFGGIGGTLYIASWLLLPADNDETSALESLVGRGRSSVSPTLTVALLLLLVIGGAGSINVGLPIWPLLIILGVLWFVGHKHHRGPFRPGGPWQQQWQQRVNPAAPPVAEDATVRSPFDTPAFWDSPEPGTAAPASAPDPMPATPQPPAWDPLGVAPFAWDLPEVDLTPPPPPAPKPSWVARLTLPVALIACGVAAAGVLNGVWFLTWAQVSGIALAIVALGLFLASLRGRGLALIGPGIVLAVVTAILALTGMSGAGGFGDRRHHPATVAELQAEYRLNAGELTLDLGALRIPAGTTRSVTVSVAAGNAMVHLPENLNAEVTCVTNAGDTDCLGVTHQGINFRRDALYASQQGAKTSGTLQLTVEVGAGQATVTRG